MPETQDVTKVEPSTTTTDPLEAPLPEGTKEETAKRFKELLDDRKAGKDKLAEWEKLGVTPEDVAAMREQVGHIETLTARINELEAVREPGEPKTDEQKKLEIARREARKEFSLIAPELDKIGELERRLAELEGERSAGRGRLDSIADATTADLLKEAGYAVTPENVGRWSRRLVPIIQDNPKLRDQFFRGDPAGAIKAAWEEHHEDSRQYHERKTKAEIQRQKEKLAGLPKGHTGPGGPATQQTAPPKTAAEGVARAMSRLGEGGR